MAKKSSGYKKFLSILSTLDINPSYFQFGIGKKGRFGTGVGGCWFLLFLLLGITWLLKSCFSFFNWAKYDLVFIEKSIYPSPIMNFEKMNFNFAMQISFRNNTSIKNSIYKDLFIVESLIKKFNGKKNEKIFLKTRPCKKEDFKETENDALFTKISYEDLICVENSDKNIPIEIQGTHNDEKISFVQNEVKINRQFFSANFKENLEKVFEENLFKFKIYYTDTLNDIASLDNPITQKIESINSYLNLFLLKKLKLNFQQFTYMEAKNMLSHSFFTKDFFKQVSFQENDIGIPNRNSDKDIHGKDILLQSRLHAHNNIKIAKKVFMTLPEFLSIISASLSNILIWSCVIISYYNWVQAKQYVFAKIMKYSDTVDSKCREKISYFMTVFNQFEIKKRVGSILGFTNKEGTVNFLSRKKSTFLPKIQSNEKGEVFNSENSIENNPKNPIFKSIKSIREKDEEKENKLNNEDDININNNDEINNDTFNPSNFFGKEIELADKNKKIDNEILQKYNSDNLLKVSQKEKLNESHPEMLPEDAIKKENPNSMGFCDIMLYIFCCGQIRSKKKANLFENGNKIFNKNLDLIHFMNKMQEIDIIKYLILDKEQLDIMNFISKPAVSMTSDKNTRDQNEEYNKFFFPAEKVNTIDFNNIENLKSSFDTLVNKPAHATTVKRMLDLFNIQLADLNHKQFAEISEK